MRLVWVRRRGLPAPRSAIARSSTAAGRHIATPDLLDVESGTYGEYDGCAAPRSARQRARDVTRENDLRNLGLEGFTILSADIPHPGRAVEKMTDARRRARWQPESQRQWTIEPPTWWTPTHTVEMRRRLSESQRARFLRRRAS